MLGISAWLTMIFIILFLVSSQLVRSASAALIFGIIMIPLACLMYKKSAHQFQKQFSLAISLTGQTLFYIAITSINFFSENTNTKITISATFAIIISIILIKIYEDKIHRFISTIIIIGAMTVIVSRLNIPVLFNVLPLFIGILVVSFSSYEQRLLQLSNSDMLRPLQYGLLFSLMFILLPATSLFTKEILQNSHFFLSTIGIGLSLLYLEYTIVKKIGYTLFSNVSLFIYSSTIIFIMSTLQAPGITASFLVILLGFSSGDKIIQGTGISFLVWYTSNYYYFMNISLLDKSLSLITTGIILLIIRYIIRFCTRNKNV